jgi:hypothetical protein
MSVSILRQMVEICPWRIGSRVTVKQGHVYATDFPGVWVVVGLRWEYQRGDGHINVEIASDSEIQRGAGATDGWSVDDFEPTVRPEPDFLFDNLLKGKANER